MKFPKQISFKKFAIILTMTILLSSSGIAFVLAQTPSDTFYLAGGAYPAIPSFTMWREGSNYFIKDENGLIPAWGSGTNESTILQTAVDSLTFGGRILLKTANYTLDVMLNITNYGIILEGQAHQGGEEPLANIIAGTAMTSMINAQFGSTQGSFEIRNLVLDGQFAGTNGLTLRRGLYHLVENVRIIKCNRGLYLIGVAKSNFRNMRMEQNTHGIYLIDDSGISYPPNELLFSRIDSVDNTAYGIYAAPSGAFTMGIKATFEQCVIESNHEWGAYFYNTNWFTFDRCLFELNNKDVVGARDDLHIEYATERDAYVSVEDCDFIGTDVTYSLNVFSADHVKVENSYFNDAVRLSYCKYVSVTTNGFTVAPTLSVLFNVTFRSNQGFVTVNSGNATIATGATIAHGLSGIPDSVTVTAGEAGPTDVYLTAVGATTFTVNFGGGGAKKFYWSAEYKI